MRLEQQRLNVQGRIKQVRADLGMSQVALGEILGVSGAAVSRWENGSRKPPKLVLRVLEQLAERVYGG